MAAAKKVAAAAATRNCLHFIFFLRQDYYKAGGDKLMTKVKRCLWHYCLPSRLPYCIVATLVTLIVFPASKRLRRQQTTALTNRHCSNLKNSR